MTCWRSRWSTPRALVVVGQQFVEVLEAGALWLALVLEVAGLFVAAFVEWDVVDIMD